MLVSNPMDIPSADVFKMVGLLTNLVTNKNFKEMLPLDKRNKVIRKYWKVEPENHDMITMTIHRGLERAFHDVAVDIINENGWHISSMDYIDDENMTIGLSPDEGMVLAPPVPLLMYHITLASNLKKIKQEGLQPSTGEGSRHEIRYTPRTFLTSTPNSVYGVEFPEQAPLAMVAIKTWMLPGMLYHQDPQFAGRGYESCYVEDPIPPSALEFPTKFPTIEIFRADEDISVTEFVPVVRIPKRVMAKRIYELGKLSPTPVKTTFFNVAGSLIDKTPYHKTKFFNSKLGRKLDDWFINKIATNTPPGHPWNEGPVFKYFRR